MNTFLLNFDSNSHNSGKKDCNFTYREKRHDCTRYNISRFPVILFLTKALSRFSDFHPRPPFPEAPVSKWITVVCPLNIADKIALERNVNELSRKNISV